MTDKQFLERMANTGQCYKRDCARCQEIFSGRKVCLEARKHDNNYTRYKRQEAKDLLSHGWFYEENRKLTVDK